MLAVRQSTCLARFCPPRLVELWARGVPEVAVASAVRWNPQPLLGTHVFLVGSGVCRHVRQFLLSVG